MQCVCVICAGSVQHLAAPLPGPFYSSHPRTLPTSPAAGGGGAGGGWPLLIQRLGICIWLLFVNQWSDCAGRRLSPRLPPSLSLSVRVSVCLSQSDAPTLKTQLHARAECVDIMQSHETTLFVADKHTNHVSSSSFWCVFLCVWSEVEGTRRVQQQSRGKQECFFRFQRVWKPNGSRCGKLSLFLPLFLLHVCVCAVFGIMFSRLWFPYLSSASVWLDTYCFFFFF